MRFNWSMRDLDSMSDKRMVLALINERRSDLNPYAPLSQRLHSLSAAVERSNLADQEKEPVTASKRVGRAKRPSRRSRSVTPTLGGLR